MANREWGDVFPQQLSSEVPGLANEGPGTGVSLEGDMLHLIAKVYLRGVVS